jgi:tetratricopeptide (TPR) repeat protein
MGRLTEAIEQYEQGLQRMPDAIELRCRLGSMLVSAGRYREAFEHLDKALQQAPNEAELHRSVAWAQAAHESSGVEPERAVQLARRACDLTGHRDARCLDTLGVCYAAAGRFDEAVAAADEARRLAEAAGQNAAARTLRMQLQLFRDRKPYRESIPKPEQRQP